MVLHLIKHLLVVEILQIGLHKVSILRAEAACLGTLFGVLAKFFRGSEQTV